jgi:APA family basic amino acid/polyamine antiporter
MSVSKLDRLAGSSSSGVFLRNATGLVREISPLGAIAVGSFALSVGAALAFTVTATPTLYPGSNLVITLLLSVIPAVIVAFLYSTLGGAMPRSGGEYIWLSRLLPGVLGFTMFWGFFLTQVVYAAGNLNIAFSYFANGFLYLLGTTIGSQTLVDWGAKLSGHTATFIAATILNLLVLAFMMLPTRKQMRAIVWTLVLSLVGFAVLAVVLAFTNDFDTSFGARYGAGKLGTIYSDARQAGAELDWRFWPSLVAVAYVAQFLPVTYVAMYAGEIKNAARNVRVSVFAATGLFVVALTGITALLYHAVGYRFMAALAFLQVNSPEKYPFDFPFNVNYAVLLVSRSSVIVTIVSLAFLLSAVLAVVTILFSVTRVVFAYAWDRMFPSVLAETSRRTSTPVKAAIFLAVAVEIMLYVFTYTTAFANLVFGAIAYWVLWAGVGLAAAVFPFRRRDLYESSPISHRRIAGVPAVTVAGAILFLFAVVAIPLLFWNGAGVIDTPVAIVLVAFYVGGPVLYAVIRTVRRRQGIDLSKAYQEIPAE